MKPLDPRLVRYARSARGFIIGIGLLGALTALAVIVQALLISYLISPIITSVSAGSQAVGLSWPLLGALATTVTLRALAAAAQERFAHRSAQRVIAELRQATATHALALGPRYLATHGTDLTVLATRSLDDLAPYFTRYLPQLIATVIITPTALVTMAVLDLWSALILAVAIPLIPIFMILIGRLTQTVADRRLATMQRLGSQVLDLVAGLPTLRGLHREHGPEGSVRRLGTAHREATMRTLQVAFLSGAVLELLATLGVALVAVTIGFRLLASHTTLTVALAVIMLAPEVLNPLRAVGAQFHAAADGVAAADATFTLLQTPLPARGTRTCPNLAGATFTFTDVSVTAGDRDRRAPAHLSATIAPGIVTALTGPNGAGKSTAILALLGLVPPDEGRVTLRADGHEVDVADVDPLTLWQQVVWVPQRVIIEPGTVGDFISAGRTLDAATRARVVSAAALTDIAWDRELGQGGVGLSVGQRQRLALARALASVAPVVILDEPTAHLDFATESAIVATIAALRAQERTVILVAHRPSLRALADRTVAVRSS